MKLLSIATLAAILLAGCATPTVVDTKKVGDANLTCDQLKQEIADAEKFEKEARKERTVTGKNVAAAILFWPALIGTYSNTEEAINAAKERKENILKLAESKNCKI
jgi:outer membrane biogenesis lipoprotein LolB